MKKIVTIIFMVLSMSVFAKDKNGLLIIAHGSPSPQWNKPVLALEDSVNALLSVKQIAGFDQVKVALMENTEPSVATVVKQMENSGIAKIYVVPLFIAPSSHSVYDVPSILGLYYNKKEGDALKEEGTKIVQTEAHITVGPSLDYANVIEEILLERVKELSRNPKNEAVVILAHGDDDFLPFWESMTNKVGKYILGQTGIEYFDKAFMEVGQSFAINGVSAILRAANEKERVIVVGVYLSMGVNKIPDMSGMVMMGHTVNSSAMLKGKNVVYSDKGLLPSSKITEWIVARAVEWLNR
jgi:cobalamin biosynthesis Co2+ chelatase CbiK